MEIFTTPKFDRRYRKLPIHIKLKAEQKGDMFAQNVHDPRLETHKLHGKDRECWAYSIDQNYRVKFIFKEDGNILYINVGTHDEVY